MKLINSLCSYVSEHNYTYIFFEFANPPDKIPDQYHDLYIKISASNSYISNRELFVCAYVMYFYINY